MLVQRDFSFVGFGAFVAVVGSLSSVNTKVALQMVASSKGLWTLWTIVRLSFIRNTKLPLHVTTQIKCNWTLGTTVPPFFTICTKAALEFVACAQTFEHAGRLVTCAVMADLLNSDGNMFRGWRFESKMWRLVATALGRLLWLFPWTCQRSRNLHRKTKWNVHLQCWECHVIQIWERVFRSRLLRQKLRNHHKIRRCQKGSFLLVELGKSIVWGSFIVNYSV